jgi:hypothetical protein
MAAGPKSWYSDIVDLWKATLALLSSIWTPDLPKFEAAIQKWWVAIIVNALDVATPILTAGVDTLQPIITNFVSTWQANGQPLADAISEPIAALAAATFNKSSSNLTAAGESTPANAVSQAAAAFSEAFGFGISSAAVTAAFEALFPEKLNTLNGVGPMLAQMAGFEEIAQTVLKPLYENAFGKSLEYQYRSTFKPELPSEGDAVRWHSRRLLTDAQLTTLFGYSGLKPEYEAAFIAAAYRTINPRTLSNMFVDQPVDTTVVTASLQNYGLNDADVALMLQGIIWNATKSAREQYVAAAVRSTELGTMTSTELGQVLTSENYSQDAQTLIQLTVATRKLEQLAELYRKSISEGYGYGTITDAQYVPMLEAAGIGAADAEAHYAVDSVKKFGKAAVAAERAAVKLTTQQERAAQKAAIVSFRVGTLNATELTAALVAAQMDPVVAGFTLVIEQQRQLGPMVYIYGVELTRDQGVALRERVSALGKQATAGLVTPAQALIDLAGDNIPSANAKALVAGWAATKTPAADVGVLEPR